MEYPVFTVRELSRFFYDPARRLSPSTRRAPGVCHDLSPHHIYGAGVAGQGAGLHARGR